MPRDGLQSREPTTLHTQQTYYPTPLFHQIASHPINMGMEIIQTQYSVPTVVFSPGLSEFLMTLQTVYFLLARTHTFILPFFLLEERTELHAIIL